VEDIQGEEEESGKERTKMKKMERSKDAHIFD
jgi:hypothetical protein